MELRRNRLVVRLRPQPGLMRGDHMGQTNFEAIGIKKFGKPPVTLVSDLLYHEETFDPPSIAAGSGAESSDITVPGAKVGDTVEVAAPYSLQGIMASGYVSADDKVKIVLFNPTGSSIDLAEGKWRIKVLKW
jgi:hypothetical protein